MAGLKFGSLFNDISAGFKDSMTKIGKKFEDSMGGSDVSGFKIAEKRLKDLGLAAERAADEVADAKRELDKLTKGTPQYTTALNYLDQAQTRATRITELETKGKEILASRTENIIKVETEGIGVSKKYSKSIHQINDDYKKSVAELAKASKSQDDYNAGMKKLKTDMIKKKLQAGLDDSGPLLQEGMQGVSNMITSGIGAVVPALQPFMQIIEMSVIKAFEQVNELNNSLINLQRATGGMVNASRLGYDQFGNSSKGMMSLKTSALAANVSVEQFGDALKSLSSGGFGQTIGTTQDLSKAQEDLSKYGVEAARMMKMYGADLGPSVRNLFQNFGKGIGEATKMLKEGADKARALGLNAAAFVKNFEAVTDLVGSVYMATSDQMQKMATIATQLGVSVGTMSKGLIKMGGITELFSQQQRNAALGLDTTAKALSKIYALRQQGKGGDAAKLEFSALAKDMQKQGMTKGGQVTQQGIATLEAAGVTQDAIAGIQKMAMMAEKTGIDVGQLGDTSKLTKMQQLKLAKEEAANITLEEQFGQIKGLFLQSFIDPLAKIFGPLMKGLMNAVLPIVKVFNTLMSIIMDVVDIAVTPLVEIFTQFTDTIADVMGPLSNAFNNIKTAITPMTDAFKSIGKFLAKVFMFPLRVLGKIVGGIIDVFGGVVKVVGEKLAPVFTWLGDLFKSGGDMIDGVLDGITVAFSWLTDLVTGVGKPFEDLWAGLKKLLKLFGFLDDDKGKASDSFATNWDQVLGGQQGGAVMNTPSIPTANINTGFVKPPSSSFDDARSSGNTTTPGNTAPIKNNITINTKVDGIISNEQSIKKAT